MPKFSAGSREQLSTCHPDLQAVFNFVVEHFDCKVIEGHRSLEQHAINVAAGKSHATHSFHTDTPSLAVDVAPYPIDWEDTKRFTKFAYFVLGVAAAMNIKIRWGGDWNMNNIDDQKFNDLVHFELVK